MRSSDPLHKRHSLALALDGPDACAPYGIGCDGDPGEKAQVQLSRAPLLILSYVFRGSGSLVQDGRRHAITAGCAVIRLPDRNQELHFTTRPRYGKTWLTLPPSALGPLTAITAINPDRPVWPVADPQRCLRTWRTRLAAWTAQPPASAISAWAGVFELLAAMVPPTPGKDGDPVARAAALIDADPVAAASPRRLAEMSGLGWHSFRSRFRMVTGRSVTAYRIEARIRLASRLLLELPVATVAERLGYANAFAFSAQFRRYRGMSPRAWQQAHRG